jgi:polyisoprenoid-binding protein YceI
MKSLIVTLVLVFSTLIGVRQPAVNMIVSKTESSVTWTGKKVTGEHFGKVTISKADLKVVNNRITGGSFEMDMTSITVEDIKDANSNKRLTDHLKSDDFFSVDKFTKANLSIKDVKTSNGSDYQVTADLTIKGITQPVSFNVQTEMQGTKMIASAKIIFDRTKYDIKYRSGNYFENLADRLIYDDVTLDIRLVATAS